MKKPLFRAVLLGLVFGFSSCSKDSDNSNSYVEDHRFFVQATIKGQPLQLKAGQENYYLETNYQLEDGVLQSTGMLAPDGSETKNALKLIYRGPRLLQNVSEFRPDSNLIPGPVAFRDASSYKAKAGYYRLALSIDSSISVTNPSWIFPDGDTSYQHNPSVEVNAFERPVFPVTLRFKGPGCESSITHHIEVLEQCKASFDVHALGSSVLEFTPKADVNALHRTDWYINNQKVQLEANGTYPIALQNISSLDIRAEFFFKDGCEKVVEREFFPQGDYCLPDFSANKNVVRVHDEHQLGTVELIYYDENGTAYSSHYYQVDGEFLIMATTGYQKNEAGQNTTRFFFETDAVLKSASGDTLHLKDAYGSFAVAHP